MRIHEFRSETDAGRDGDAVGNAGAISCVGATGRGGDDDHVGSDATTGAADVGRYGARDSRGGEGLLIRTRVGIDGDVMMHDVLDAGGRFNRLLPRPSSLGQRIAESVPDVGRNLSLLYRNHHRH